MADHFAVPICGGRLMTLNPFALQFARQTWRSSATLVALIVVGTAAPVHADLVKLLNGGELRGHLVRGTGSAKSTGDNLVLETMTGATVTVARADTKFVTMRPLIVEEYESRARHAPDTLEAQWELSEWCRQHLLSKQRETHLLRVVALDPRHEKAQTALDRVWHEGAWVDREELMASKGYVKYKNRYITVQELDLIQKSADELAAEREWFQKIKLWHNWLGGRNPDRGRQAHVSLQQIDDPHAAPAIIKLLCEDRQREIRALGVSVLTKIAGAKGAAGLIKLSLFDPDADVRYASLNGIAEADFEFAQSVYVKELRHSMNVVVCRAAAALARVGNEQCVGPLIDALVTSHRYQVETNVPVAPSYSFGTDGSFGSSGTVLPPEVEIAMRTGQLPQGAIVMPTVGLPVQKKTIVVTVNQPNQDALTTLQKLTGQNFGFDERTWRLWWAAEKNAGGAAKPAKN
jgi:hypothetical protein